MIISYKYTTEQAYIQMMMLLEAGLMYSHYSIKHISEMKVVYYELLFGLEKKPVYCHVMQIFFFPISISIFVTCILNNKRLKNEGISPPYHTSTKRCI